MRRWSRVTVALAATMALAGSTLFAVLGAWSWTVGAALVAALLVFSLVAPARLRRLALVAALALPVTIAVVRVLTVRLPPQWSMCDDNACSATGPWWARLVPEAVAFDAGFQFAQWAGIASAAEAREYRALFDAQYSHLPDVPNAGVLFSTADRVRLLRFEPPGDEPLPCLVFLHGFGGLSSSYLEAMASTDVGRRVIIVAPALDPFARWDTPRGRAVVEATLRTLPPRADRSRLVLVGLSNGAIFGAAHADLFRATVLVSGVGEPPKGPVLIFSGASDVRIGADWVTERTASLQRKGLTVTLDLVPAAGHGVLLSHSARWASQVNALLESLETK